MIKIIFILAVLGILCSCGGGIKWTPDKYITIGRMCCDRCSERGGLYTVSEHIFDNGGRLYRCFCNNGTITLITQTTLNEMWDKRNKCDCSN